MVFSIISLLVEETSAIINGFRTHSIINGFRTHIFFTFPNISYQTFAIPKIYMLGLFKIITCGQF